MKRNAILLGALFSIGSSTVSSTANADGEIEVFALYILSNWAASASSLAPVIANSYYLSEGRAPSPAWSTIGFGLGTANAALALTNALVFGDHEPYSLVLTLPASIAATATLATTVLAHGLADEAATPADTTIVVTPFMAPGQETLAAGLTPSGSF